MFFRKHKQPTPKEAKLLDQISQVVECYLIDEITDSDTHLIYMDNLLGWLDRAYPDEMANIMERVKLLPRRLQQ